jgi:cytochrome c oxidase subunit 4
MSSIPHTDSHAHDDANAPKKYAIVLGVLLLLTFITVAASKVQFGSGMINVVIALTIATIKASLVALFFMHLLHDKAMNGIIIVSSFIFLGIFLISCYTDQETRDPILPSNLKLSVPAAAGASSPPTNEATPAPAHH